MPLKVCRKSIRIFYIFSGDVEELEIQEKPALKVFKSITVVQEPGMVVLEVRPSYRLPVGRASVSKCDHRATRLLVFQDATSFKEGSSQAQP